MKFLVDMNLSPTWCDALRAAGWDAAHWAEVGDSRATDAELLTRARDDGLVVLTNDLDFGAILSATRASGPSVVQIRAQRLLPADLGEAMILLLRRYERELEQGALVVLDDARSRVRILPLRH